MDVSRLPGLAAAALLGTAFLLAGCAESDPTAQRTKAMAATDTIPSGPVFDVRSVTLDARRRPEPDLLPRLRDLGVTHVTLVPFGWQRAADDPQVRIDTSDGWYSESHRGIRSLARQADSLGMGVILKPHIWIGGYDEQQDRSDIGFDAEAKWARWEESYRRFLLIYARLAEEIDADGLVVGTELSRPATTRSDFFRALADTVRTVYDGNLTYAANWHDEYDKITFWDALDYVGVQAYFPLVDTPDPSLDTLRDRWRTHRRTLSELHQRTGKPILFTEIGYRSARTAAKAPWRWPEKDGGAALDSALQARCYRAFLSTMQNTPWFTGAAIWKWHPRTSRRDPTAFTPQGKPAERVLYRWFTGAGPDVPVQVGEVGADPTPSPSRQSR
jgi:hypothetical protein